MIAKVGCRRFAILNFDVIKSIGQMNIHIEMDQGVKKLGPYNMDSKFLFLEILGQYYEGQFFSF